MASVKLKFLEKKVLKDGTHPLAIQVIHDRQKKLFYLGHSLNKSEWDEENYQPNKKYSNYRLLRSRIKTAINELESIILELENSKENFTLLDIEKKYKPEQIINNSAVTFNSFVDEIIFDLIKYSLSLDNDLSKLS